MACCRVLSTNRPLQSLCDHMFGIDMLAPCLRIVLHDPYSNFPWMLEAVLLLCSEAAIAKAICAYSAGTRCMPSPLSCHQSWAAPALSF